MILCICNIKGAKVPIISQIETYDFQPHTSSFFGSGFFASGFFLGIGFFGGGFLSASSSVEETIFFLGGFFFTSSSEEELSDEDELEDDSELSDNCKKVRAKMFCAKVLREKKMMCWETSHNENKSFFLEKNYFRTILFTSFFSSFFASFAFFLSLSLSSSLPDSSESFFFLSCCNPYHKLDMTA